MLGWFYRWRGLAGLSGKGGGGGLAETGELIFVLVGCFGVVLGLGRKDGPKVDGVGLGNVFGLDEVIRGGGFIIIKVRLVL